MLGLPSLLTLDHAQGARIWFAAEATDMRCGFDRLAERVRAVIGQDPLGGHLFVFRSRRGDRLKILLWDRDGFVLWYKRLETGVFTGFVARRNWNFKLQPDRKSTSSVWSQSYRRACA